MAGIYPTVLLALFLYGLSSRAPGFGIAAAVLMTAGLAGVLITSYIGYERMITAGHESRLKFASILRTVDCADPAFNQHVENAFRAFDGVAARF